MESQGPRFFLTVAYCGSYSGLDAPQRSCANIQVELQTGGDWLVLTGWIQGKNKNQLENDLYNV